MSHPFLQLNSKNWVLILDKLKDLVGALPAREGVPAEEIQRMVQNYHGVIEAYRDYILDATYGDLQRYINFYNVKPRDGAFDEFKHIHFIGMAVSRRLNLMGLADVNKYHLRAMLRLLDIRLEEPYRARRPQLTERIRALIDNGASAAIEQHLGMYGWYLVYKCLYNAAQERAGKE